MLMQPFFLRLHALMSHSLVNSYMGVYIYIYSFIAPLWGFLGTQTMSAAEHFRLVSARSCWLKPEIARPRKTSIGRHSWWEKLSGS